MNIENLKFVARKPKIYERGDSEMWTDDHISKQLLKIHLNPEIEAASRMPQSINSTTDFIANFCDREKMKILDLGCGPGLYAEKFAMMGHHVTGVDFSRNSTAYAKTQAKQKNMNIKYECRNYLLIDFKNEFDLIILIYTDFGVLLPSERNSLLEKVKLALKPEGTFIFDVINDKHISEKFQETRTWTYENSGFWKPYPYLELINGFHYAGSGVFLKQHTIFSASSKINNYRFWIHYFDDYTLTVMLSEKGFHHTECFENILPATDIWSGENVTFYKTKIDN
jgi:2-polyprenyl-3-methyl-5-hydroxy-6-metoxy-1,4-benzoquinol methylase